ncbi:hydrogen peroxide-inducible genes activator [Francisellaceae bacterium]|nr:hydrogen peroxide-inducible genes activator [Francisellaceae bacterium]
MNFRDLEYIIAVAKYQSFHIAADKCYVSQPALSMQIKKMENELDLKLFERYKKQVLITPIGEKIIAKAQEILLLKEDFQNIINLSKNPFTAKIKLGVFPTLAQYYIPKFLPDIHSKHPDLQIVPIEEKTEILLQKLNSGSIDAALLAMPVNQADIICKELFQDKFLVAVHKNHPLAKRKKISLEDIRSEHMLILQQGHCLRDQIIAIDHELTFDDTATSLETLRQMVQVNLGITVMPKIATTKRDCNCTEACTSNPIVFLEFEDPQPFRRIALVYRKSSPYVEVFDSLEKILKASYKKVNQ